jgi:hypothetical protein
MIAEALAGSDLNEGDKLQVMLLLMIDQSRASKTWLVSHVPLHCWCQLNFATWYAWCQAGNGRTNPNF